MKKISCFFILSLILSNYSFNSLFSDTNIHQEDKKINKNEKSNSGTSVNKNEKENDIEQKNKKEVVAENNQEKQQKKTNETEVNETEKNSTDNVVKETNIKEINKDNDNEIEKIKDKQNQNYHIVKDGENIYRILKKYNITHQELIQLNNIKNDNIYIGQKLILPKNAFLKEDINDDEKNNENTRNKNLNNKTVITNDVQNQNLNKNLINKLDPTTFIWPSRGIILTKFGYKTKTGRLEGVNIGGETGSVVRASSSGTVVYNNTIEGYDNVIIIKHYNGFITAYGYTEPIIMIGDKVKKGQIIAYMKKNKQSKRSQLYFTIRKDGKSYDPEKIIQTKISD